MRAHAKHRMLGFMLMALFAATSICPGAEPPVKEPPVRTPPRPADDQALERAPTDGSGDIAQASRAVPDRAVVYRQVDGAELVLQVFAPEGGPGATPRPAVVFFHGGAWRKGSPQQFYWQARYLAQRGMVAFSAQYRLVADAKDPAPGRCAAVTDCIEDAQSAIRFVRERAAEFGIDPTRVAAAGGSAGGHLAAACALRPAPGAVSSRPDLLLLFNPALFHTLGGQTLASDDFSAQTPPAICFYGSRDEMVDYGREVQLRARQLGNEMELHLAPGQGHGFFNREPWRSQTLRLADGFLTRHDFLTGEASLPVDPAASLELQQP